MTDTIQFEIDKSDPMDWRGSFKLPSGMEFAGMPGIAKIEFEDGSTTAVYLREFTKSTRRVSFHCPQLPKGSD